MSKHWPPDNVARPDFRRRLGRRGANPRVAIALLGGAALTGAAIGVGESLLTQEATVAAGPAIEWNEVQAVASPEMAADDQAWEDRARDSVDEAPTAVRSASVTRASFGLCHTGGGSNCVVDGDTIWLAGQRIRVADIDAPETHPPRCAQEAELGDRATRRLRELLSGGAISLQSIDRDEDVYGRKLRVGKGAR